MVVPDGSVALLEDGTRLCGDCYADNRYDHPYDTGPPLVWIEEGDCDLHPPEETVQATGPAAKALKEAEAEAAQNTASVECLRSERGFVRQLRNGVIQTNTFLVQAQAAGSLK